MQRIIFLIFFSILVPNCYSQRLRSKTTPLTAQDSLKKINSLLGFYQKIRYTDLFINFTSSHAPSIGIGSNRFKTTIDSSSSINSLSQYKDEFHILKFIGHPLFNNSIKGRLEMFTSICSDGSCVREVSNKLYFDFETETAAREFLCSLIDSLLPLSEKQWYTKTEAVEKYEFAADLRPDRYEPEFMRYMQYVVLALSQAKSGFGFQIFIGDYYPEDK